MFTTIVAVHLAYPYLALDKVSGSETYQDAETFVQLIEVAGTSNEVKTIFKTRFSDERN